MTRLLATALAASLAFAVPAHADDASVAQGVALVITYDQQCQRLPANIMQMVPLALQGVPNATLASATQKILADYQSMGSTRFCVSARAVIDKVVGSL